MTRQNNLYNCGFVRAVLMLLVILGHAVFCKYFLEKVASKNGEK